jgi:hypothetical protein
MRSLVHVFLAAAACVLCANCGSEAITEPVAPQGRPYSLRVLVDTVIPLGARLAPVVTVTTKAGAVVPLESRPLYDLAVDDSLILPYNRTGSDFAFSAAYPGTATVIFTSRYPSDTVRVRVRVVDTRPVVNVALGTTANGQLAVLVSDGRYAVALAAGDTIDIAASGATLLRQLPGSPVLDGYRLEGALVKKFSLAANFTSALRVVAPGAGIYAFDAVRSAGGTAAGPFAFAVRRGGPVLVMSYNPHGNAGSLVVPSFGSIVDTVWVRNIGSGSPTASLLMDQSWITTNGAFNVPASPYVPADSTAPQGTPVQLLLDLKGSASAPRATVRLQADSSALIFGAPLSFAGLVYDGIVRILQKNYFDAITLTPAGLMYGLKVGNIERLDLASGLTTRVPAISRGYQEIVATSDGNVFVRFCQDCFNVRGDTVAQVASNGTLNIVLGFAGSLQRPAMAGGANGDLYIKQGSTLYRRTAAGIVTPIATALTIEASGNGNSGMVYHPGENALYYVLNSKLMKFDLASSTESFRGPLTGLRVWAVDGKGRLVGTPYSRTGVQFVDTLGAEVAFIASPTTTTTVTIRGNEVLGAGPPQRNTNYLWVAPVP